MNNTNNNILIFAKEYLADIKEAKYFMVNEYGDAHFLQDRNQKNIPKSRIDIKGSRIKSFHYHGRGCSFRTKSYVFDIEFDLKTKAFSFTSWQVYMYLKGRLKDNEINEEDAKKVLKELESQSLITENLEEKGFYTLAN